MISIGWVITIAVFCMFLGAIGMLGLVSFFNKPIEPDLDIGDCPEYVEPKKKRKRGK